MGYFRPFSTADFNRDSAPDHVLFNPATRVAKAVLLENNRLLAGSPLALPIIAASNILVDAADFDGDGNPDLLLQNPSTKALTVWFLNASGTYARTRTGPPIPAGNTFAGTGHANTDGLVDIFFLNPATLRMSVGYQTATTWTAAAGSLALPSTDDLVGIADFNSDTVADYILKNKTSGALTVWYLTNINTRLGLLTLPAARAGYSFAGVADYNRDFSTDLLLRQNGTNALLARYMTAATIRLERTTPAIEPGFNLITP